MRQLAALLSFPSGNAQQAPHMLLTPLVSSASLITCTHLSPHWHRYEKQCTSAHVEKACDTNIRLNYLFPCICVCTVSINVFIQLWVKKKEEKKRSWLRCERSVTLLPPNYNQATRMHGQHEKSNVTAT